MLLHVSQRTQESLFLAGPERDADGPPRLQSQRLNQAHGLDHDGGADGVVGGAGGRVPGIQMAAEHHDLIGFVGARNFGYHVVTGLALGIGAVDDVELQLDVLPSARRRSMRP